jgi:hypothetical protein
MHLSWALVRFQEKFANCTLPTHLYCCHSPRSWASSARLAVFPLHLALTHDLCACIFRGLWRCLYHYLVSAEDLAEARTHFDAALDAHRKSREIAVALADHVMVGRSWYNSALVLQVS